MNLQMTKKMIEDLNQYEKEQSYIEAHSLLVTSCQNLENVNGETMRDSFTIGVIKQQLKDAIQKLEEAKGEKCANTQTS